MFIIKHVFVTRNPSDLEPKGIWANATEHNTNDIFVASYCIANDNGNTISITKNNSYVSV